MKIKNKIYKKGISDVVTIILVLVSVIIILAIAVKFYKMLGNENQNLVCSADIVFSKQLMTKDLWGLDSLARSAVTHPMCKTFTKEINLTKYEGSQLKERAAIEIGEMVEDCWKTFGEGKIINTFGQGDKNAIGFSDKRNYYFSCYKFKIHAKNAKENISVDELISLANGKGLLWKYNLKGAKIEGTPDQIYQRAKSGDKSALSYAGYVFNSDKGYIEFLGKVEDNVSFKDIGSTYAERVAAGAAMGAAVGVVFFGVTAIPAAGVGALAGLIDATVKVMFEGLVRNNYPNSGTPLAAIYPEQYYEVRYYSPYIKNVTQYGADTVFNSIKIVPVLENSAGTEIESIIKE